MAKYTPQEHLEEARGLLEHISTEARENPGNFTKEDVQSLALTAIAHCLAGSLALVLPGES